MIGKWKGDLRLGPSIKKKEFLCRLGDMEPDHLVLGNCGDLANVHVQSESSWKTTLYLYVRNSSCSFGISVLRIYLQPGVFLFTTRHNSLLSIFHSGFPCSTTICWVRSVSFFQYFGFLPTSIIELNTKLTLEHWVQTIIWDPWWGLINYSGLKSGSKRQQISMMVSNRSSLLPFYLLQLQFACTCI